MVWEWRKSWADIQNQRLKASGIDRFFDPRSYAAQGIDKVAGEHMGSKQAALEASGRGADAWNREAADWQESKRSL